MDTIVSTGSCWSTVRVHRRRRVNPSAARWFAIGTGLLALAAVCVALLMVARLHRTRSALVQLGQPETCVAAPAAAPTMTP